MQTVKISTVCSYRLDNDYIKFSIATVEEIPVMEIYDGNNLIYYKPLGKEERDLSSDMEVINHVVEKMPSTRNRWLDVARCQWLVNSFPQMMYKERTTVYEFVVNNKVAYIHVTEDYNKHAKLHLLNDETKDRLSIDFDIQPGSNILQACAEYVDLLNVIVGVFKSNVLEINKPTLQKRMFTE